MTEAERSSSRNWRAIADEIEAKFMRPLPPATYPSEWSFGITMDYRDWHEVVKALRGGAAVSERRCIWYLDGDAEGPFDNGTYATDCGHFYHYEGTLKECEANFCQGCGGKIAMLSERPEGGK